MARGQVIIMPTIQSNRTTIGEMSKYLARPPHTPASHLSLLRLSSFSAMDGKSMNPIINFFKRGVHFLRDFERMKPPSNSPSAAEAVANSGRNRVMAHRTSVWGVSRSVRSKTRSQAVMHNEMKTQARCTKNPNTRPSTEYITNTRISTRRNSLAGPGSENRDTAIKNNAGKKPSINAITWAIICVIIRMCHRAGIY